MIDEHSPVGRPRQLPVGVIGDPLGMQPDDSLALSFGKIPFYNHLARSVIFGRETAEQRRVRITMFGEHLNAGVWGDIEKKRAWIERVGLMNETQYETLAVSKGISVAVLKEQVRELIENESKALTRLDNDKLQLVRAYAPPVRIGGLNAFQPLNQTGYTCVPTTIHEIGRRVAGSSWPFRTVEETRKAFEKIATGEWTNPTYISLFFQHLCLDLNIPIVGRGACEDELTLIAGLSAGGMAVAKHQDWDHVSLIEDYKRGQGGDLTFVVGSTLGGKLEKDVTLDELNNRFFNPLSGIVSVTLMIPLPKK